MRICTFLTSLLLTAVSIQAAIIHVPATQPTIQAGIDVASAGDTVLVAPGTYTGIGNRDITFNGINLVLKSEMGADVTIIDAQADTGDIYNGIYLNNGEDTSSVIDGFTITNSLYTSGYTYSNGISFENGIANVFNCILSKHGGRGLVSSLDFYADSLGFRITNSVFENNSVGLSTGKDGTIIDSCIIKNNTNYGISVEKSVFIYNCLIVHNGGAGVMQSTGMGHQPVLIDHCTIAFNQNGVYYDRTLPREADVGLLLDTSLIVNSNIVYNNSYGIYNYYDLEAEYNCLNSNVYGNGTKNWQNDKYSHGDEFGNLSVNPLFCDTTVGNYYLGERSPCAIGNNSSGSTIGTYGVGCGCCVGIRGNLNGDMDDLINVSDLVVLVCYMFNDCSIGHYCEAEVDVNGSGGALPVNITDLVYLVAYMFQSGPEPVPCN